MAIELLLIDDDIQYCMQLHERARSHQMELYYRHNLEDGIRFLIENRGIKAVILDGRCYIDAEQEGKPQSNFVTKAIMELEEIKDDYDRTIPFFINTEHPEDFTEDMEGITKVFHKYKDNDALFSAIKFSVAKLPETIIKEQFDIFNKTSKYFSQENEDILIDILQGLNSSDKVIIKTNLGNLRNLLEVLLDTVCETKLGKSPEEFRYFKGSRTRKILDEMKHSVLPIEIYNSALQLYKTCSKFGSHSALKSELKHNWSPDKFYYNQMVYSFLSLANFLLD